MAAHDGNIIVGADTFLPYGNVALGLFPDTYDYLASYDVTPSAFGSSTNTQPVTEPGNAHDGNILGEFGYLDFYFRIHLQYEHLNLGAVVNDQETPFYVFNGYLTSQDLDAFGLTTLDPGLVLTAPHGAPPVTYLPLETKTYTLEVDGDGPAVITGSVTFEFENDTITMDITGFRVLAWRWSPNWSEGFRERLNWKTDVEVSYNGEEQRRSLRHWPTQYTEFTVDPDGREQRVLSNSVYNWGARIWALPFFPDVESLVTELASGSTVIPVSSVSKQYVVGELLMIVAENEGSQEALTVESIDPTFITTTQPTSNVWAAGSRVYPARLARLENGIQLSQFIRSHAYGTAAFKSLNGVEYTSATEELYRGYPLLTIEPNQKPDPSLAYERKVEIVDFETGSSIVEDQSLLANELFAHTRTLVNRVELDDFRKFLYSRAGRWKAVWVPTFSEDLIVSETITVAATNIDFVWAGLVDLTEGGVHRRDIRIELHNGDIYYRRTSNPATVSETVERLTIDSPLGVEIEPEEIKLVSWMALSRFDADSIEITWDAPHSAESVTTYRSFTNDV